MRELKDFLTEREIFVLQNHPKRTYEDIGRELGLSKERVRQIKAHAERQIRDEKRRELNREKGKLPVDLTLTRREIFLLLRALGDYRLSLHDGRRTEETKDPDLEPSWELYKKLNDIIMGEIAADRANAQIGGGEPRP